MVVGLLEEIKYYDVTSLRDYIEAWVAPLLELGSIMRKYFREIDDGLAKYAEEIYSLSQKIVELAEEKLGLRPKLEGLREPKDIYEVVEYGRVFLEKAFNFTIACNPYTFFVWSIRKITRSYLEAHYPRLFEGNKFKEVATILGLEEYWKPPELKPRKIVEDYTLYAYLDFETEEKSKDTIGGLISKLNEKILFELSAANIKAYGALYERPDLLEKYKNMVNKILEELDWKQNAEISEIVRETIVVPGVGVIRPGPGVSFSMSIKGITIELASGKRVTLFKFLDEIMPLQMLGVIELKVYRTAGGGEGINVKVRMRF